MARFVPMLNRQCKSSATRTYFARICPPSGYVEAYGSGTVASVWAHTSDYSLDYYHNQLELGGKWQINEKWQWELNYRWVFAADNHLDGLTESFHDLFAIGQNGRDEVDKNRFYMSMPDYDILIEDFEGETLANNLSTYIQYQIIQNEHHGLSVGGSLYYNDVAHGAFKGNSFEQGYKSTTPIDSMQPMCSIQWQE